MGRLGKALVENKQWCLEGLLIVTAENAEQVTLTTDIFQAC